MGTGGSSNASAYTYIETEVSSFVPGAVVTGEIKILAEKPTQAGQMSIVFSCMSEVLWSWGYGKRRLRHNQKCTLVRIQYPIWNFQGQLPQGQFVLPFSIQLPTEIPPSFHCVGKNRGFGRNEYSFEAVIDGSNKVEALKTYVFVRKIHKPIDAILPVSSEGKFKVVSCACLKKGKVQLKSTLSRNVAMANEDLVVSSKIINLKNKHKVKKITCTLLRRVKLKTKPISDGGLLGTLFDEEEYQISQDLNIKPGQSETEVVMNLNLKQNPNFWMVPTINSEMIESEYAVKVTLGFDNLCGNGFYSVVLPIEICNGMVPINTVFSPPPKINAPWNPIMLSSIPIVAQGHTNLLYQGQNLTQDTIMTDYGTDRGYYQNGKTVVPEA